MNLLALATALLAASPTTGQSHSLLTGASPDTLIIAGGWEMTPRGSACTLTHAGGGGYEDLVIQAKAGANTLAFGVLAPADFSDTMPVQLTIMAQAETAQLVGRVTFKLVTGGPDPLLLAPWPADRLFPRLKGAERLNVFGPDQRLIRSIRLDGVEQAIDRFQRCLATEVRPAGAPATDRPPPRPATGLPDVGWLAEREGGNCRIKHATLAGNEIIFTLIKGGRDPFVTIRFYNGFHLDSGRTVQATVLLLEPKGSQERDGQELGEVRLTASNTKHGTLVFGTFNADFLRQMAEPKWTELQIGPSEWSEAINTAGAEGAVAGLMQCARTL